MALVCRKILELPYADRLVLLAGKDGLDNIIRWVHYLENPKYIKWIKGGELVIISGAMIKGEKEWIEIVNMLYRYKAAGIIINLSNYIKKVPQIVINISDNLGIPLFEMAAQIRIVDMSQSICYGIFKEQHKDNLNNNAILEVVYGQRITEKRIERLKDIGILNGFQYRVVAISFNIENKQNISENSFYDDDEAQIQYKLLFDIKNFFKNIGENVSVALDDNIILMFTRCTDYIQIKQYMRQLYEKINESFKNITVTIVIGDNFDKIRDIPKCVERTKRIIEVQKGGITDNYGDILQSMLMKIDDTEEIKEEVKNRLGVLLDDENSENFETLRQYLKSGQSIKNTAEKLFIHTNTVYYRLCKIQDLLGFKFENREKFFQLQVSMRIYELYKNTKKEI